MVQNHDVEGKLYVQTWQKGRKKKAENSGGLEPIGAPEALGF